MSAADTKAGALTAWNRTDYQRGHRDSLRAFGHGLAARHHEAHLSALRARSVGVQTVAKLRRAGLSKADADRLLAAMQWPPTAMDAANEALNAADALPEDPESPAPPYRWSSTT